MSNWQKNLGTAITVCFVVIIIVVIVILLYFFFVKRKKNNKENANEQDDNSEITQQKQKNNKLIYNIKKTQLNENYDNIKRNNIRNINTINKLNEKKYNYNDVIKNNNNYYKNDTTNNQVLSNNTSFDKIDVTIKNQKPHSLLNLKHNSIINNNTSNNNNIFKNNTYNNNINNNDNITNNNINNNTTNNSNNNTNVIVNDDGNKDITVNNKEETNNYGDIKSLFYKFYENFRQKYPEESRNYWNQEELSSIYQEIIETQFGRFKINGGVQGVFRQLILNDNELLLKGCGNCVGIKKDVKLDENQQPYMDIALLETLIIKNDLVFEKIFVTGCDDLKLQVNENNEFELINCNSKNEFKDLDLGLKSHQITMISNFIHYLVDKNNKLKIPEINKRPEDDVLGVVLDALEENNKDKKELFNEFKNNKELRQGYCRLLFHLCCELQPARIFMEMVLLNEQKKETTNDKNKKPASKSDVLNAFFNEDGKVITNLSQSKIANLVTMACEKWKTKKK